MVHAELAEIEDYPYLVFLGNDENFCAGAIVSRYNVLTAAHCVREPKETLLIRAGSKFRTKGGSVHALEVVTPHENFTVDAQELRSTYDVAVIRVKEPFEYDATRRPIKLFDKGEVTEPFQPAKAAGWGRNEGNWFPRQFSKLEFYVVHRFFCNVTFKYWGGIAEGQICATSLNPSRHYICNGDSGSPLVVGGRLAGITVYGGGCELWDSPSVYTEVAYFRDWIDKYVTYDDDDDDDDKSRFDVNNATKIGTSESRSAEGEFQKSLDKNIADLGDSKVEESSTVMENY